MTKTHDQNGPFETSAVDDNKEVACLRAAAKFITDENIKHLEKVKERVLKIAQRGGKMTQRDVDMIHDNVGSVLADLKDAHAHKTGKWLQA